MCDGDGGVIMIDHVGQQDLGLRFELLTPRPCCCEHVWFGV